MYNQYIWLHTRNSNDTISHLHFNKNKQTNKRSHCLVNNNLLESKVSRCWRHGAREHHQGETLLAGTSHPEEGDRGAPATSPGSQQSSPFDFLSFSNLLYSWPSTASSTCLSLYSTPSVFFSPNEVVSPLPALFSPLPP